MFFKTFETPRGRCHQCDVLFIEREGGVVRLFKPIDSQQVAQPHLSSGSHVAGWSESSKAQLNMQAVAGGQEFTGTVSPLWLGGQPLQHGKKTLELQYMTNPILVAWVVNTFCYSISSVVLSPGVLTVLVPHLHLFQM